MNFPSLNTILKYISLILVVLGTIYVWVKRDEYGLSKIFSLSSADEEDDYDDDDDDDDDYSDSDSDGEDSEDEEEGNMETGINGKSQSSEATTEMNNTSGFRVQTPNYDYASLGNIASNDNFENFDTFNHSVKF